MLYMRRTQRRARQGQFLIQATESASCAGWCFMVEAPARGANAIADKIACLARRTAICPQILSPSVSKQLSTLSAA